MNYGFAFITRLKARVIRAIKMASKLPKDLAILLAVFTTIIAIFGIRDVLDYQNMPPEKVNLEDVYGYYEPKRLEAAVLKYRQNEGEPKTGYSVPKATYLEITVDKITSLKDQESLATIEGTVLANWELDSVQDYQNAGNELEENARSNIFSALKLNFASQEDQLFRQVWRNKWKKDKTTKFRELYEYKGLFKLVQDYRRFPFDTSKAIIEVVSDLNAADLHLESDIEYSGLNDPEMRVNSYYYAKVDCGYPKDWGLDKEYYKPQYYCVEDEFKGADPEEFYDYIDDKKLSDVSIKNILSLTPVVTFTAFLSRAPGSSFFRYIAPIMFVIMVASIFDQLNNEAWEIKMAIPPTILLTLIFMHSGYRAEIDQISYVTFMDRIYFLAYASCVLLLLSTILSKFYDTMNHGQPEKNWEIAGDKIMAKRLIVLVRGSFLITAIIGPFVAYWLS